MFWPEKDFEEKMRPMIDGIYKKVFSNLVEIRRSLRDNESDARLMFMDKELAIDTHLFFLDGTVLTFQEKTLRHTKCHFQQFTFEYQNNPKVNEPGEWFKLAAQLYFFGYANASETAYSQYLILDVPKLRLFLKTQVGIDALLSQYLRYNPPPARASFFAIPFNLLRQQPGIIVREYPNGKSSS